MGGRNAEMQAIMLLRNPHMLLTLLKERRWAEIVPLAEYLEHDVPKELAQTDPALYRTLRAAVTDFNVRGFGQLNAAKLRQLAAGQGGADKSPKA